MFLNLVYYILYALSIVGIFIVAALVYSKRKEPEYVSFAIFATLLNIWQAPQFIGQLLAGSGSIDATLLLRLSVAVGPFFIIYFFFFATQYVGVKVKRSYHFIVPVIGALVTLTTNLVVDSASASIDGIILHEGFLYYVVTALVVGYGLLGLGFILWGGKRRGQLTATRKQANLILIIGVLQAIAIILLASTVLAKESLSQTLIPFALFLMVVIFGYAIIRHQLFDIRLIVVRALGYSFSLFTIGLVYVFLAFGLVNSLAGGRSETLQQALYLIIALILALTFAPLKEFFDKLTRSIFYQDSYESQKVIDAFSSVLVGTVDIKNLGRDAAEVLRAAIKPEYIAILLRKGNKQMGGEDEFLLVGKNTLTNEKKLFKTLAEYRDKLFQQDTAYLENKHVYKRMQVSNCVVAARLETHNDFIGYILFGPKNSGRAYTRQDIDLIRITSDELALGVQNALRFEEIRLFNRTLQEKVNEATAQLRRTNTELRRLDEAKDEFVSMASHQLRTPLTSVKGYISMVLEGDAGKITDTQRQLLGEAFTSSERMVHLINDFLNVSRLQTGKFVIEEKATDLAKVITQEVDSLQSTAKAHALTIIYRAPSHFPILYLDESKIRQVLMNFIDNAIYYSPEDSTITVSLAVEEGFAVVKVKDEGIGVPEAERAHLFSKFFRASNARKQRPDGTGVGLFLAKKVIVAQGGTMIFDSKEGEGSTFGFRLPIKKLSRSSNKTN